MPIKSIKLDTSAKKAAIALAAAAITVSAFFAAKWGFAHTLAVSADTMQVAEMALRFGPDDPQAHFTIAQMLDKTFDAADAQRAFSEYERAAELSPYNYNLWLAVANARSANGDLAAAENALRRAAELAPHYARVRWALGNNLFRQQRFDEAFVEMRRAAVSDPKYSAPAAALALQSFENDIGRAREAVGNSPDLNLALATILADGKRFDEAAAVWSAIPQEKRSAFDKKAAGKLFASFVAAKRFRDAMSVFANGAEPETILNGGFEEPIKPEKAELFDWQISGGNIPRPAISDTHKHGGKYSFLLIYAAPDGKTDRTISQTVAVEPDGVYHFEAYYRTDIKGGRGLAVRIANAADGSVIAELPAETVAEEWQRIETEITVPATTDGIVISIVSQPCAGVLCGTNGNFWLDDVKLSRK